MTRADFHPSGRSSSTDPCDLDITQDPALASLMYSTNSLSVQDSNNVGSSNTCPPQIVCSSCGSKPDETEQRLP